MSQIIQGLWIGPELSIMEQLSVASFLKPGHQYHLYVYDEVKNIPTGTIVKDGNEILPASRIFQYKDHATYAGFSNFFRYKLLLERGGWWVDTDTVCLKPFDFAEEYVFSSEFALGQEFINSGICRAPADSPAMAYAWDICNKKDPAQLVWGETGPRLMAAAVREFSLERFKKLPEVFCPIGYADWHKVLEPVELNLSAESYAIHLWNERWRAAGQDKNASYPDACLYEKLKQRYLCLSVAK
jgi:mannosyltransferase OCH1-like enzyme